MNMHINISPEFSRNLWIELGSHRLLATPLVLASIFFLVYLVTNNSPNSYYQSFYYTGVVLYFAFTMVVGTKSASESISNELKEGTWDSQRMTSISPWAMTWGKLFGSTIFSWYGGLIALCFGLLGAIELPNISSIDIALLLVAGILSHSVAMLFNLSLIARSRSIIESRSSYVFYLLLIFSAIALLKVFGSSETIIWYGETYSIHYFFVVSVVVFSVWSILGVYRLIREELQIRNSSIVWLSFVSFVSIYCAGFINIGNIQFEFDLFFARFMCAVAIFMISGYFILFIQKKDPILLSRLSVLKNQRKWYELLRTLPAWFTTFGISSLLFIALFFLTGSSDSPITYLFDNKLLLVSILLLIYRDILIVIYFSMEPTAKKVELTAILLLLVLYLLLPTIMKALGIDFLAALFFPYANQYTTITFIGSLTQLLLMIYLIYRRNMVITENWGSQT